MKWQQQVTIFGLILIISSALTTPVDYQWSLMSDGNGKMHLIDAEQPPQEEIENFFNPEADTRFLLFTRSNPTSGQVITWTRQSIEASNFNPNHPVRYLIHGFNSDANAGVNTGATAAYLQRGDYNVIVVDWSVGANTINYVSARNRVSLVADVLARLINFMHDEEFAHPKNVIIAGHSLGAHIAGLTGKRVTRDRINTIFGLDPAGPLFSLSAVNERLAANDAQYTEGIRTNKDNLGFNEPLAQADFYPNWGNSQPGCGLDLTGSCSHSRSHEFFIESINSNRFVGRRCSSFQQIIDRSCPGIGGLTGIMGGDPWSFGAEGVFFLTTNSNRPFAQG